VSWECALPFPTDDVSFILGFEAGALWERVSRAVRLSEVATAEELGLLWPIAATVHCAQAEMMLRIAEAKGVVLEWRELDELWAEAAFRVAE
jgi:hypothetical protein